MARGVPEDIGPIGDLAPPAEPMLGRVVGLRPALRVTGLLGGTLAGMATARARAAKEFNDAPGSTTVGTDRGRSVKVGARTIPTP